ncbi:MAG: MoaD/ThiS family protein [Dehalococcoidia bacterium]
MKKIDVKLFASLRSKMPDGNGRGKVELGNDATLTDLLGVLEIPEEMSQMTLINGEHCPPEQEWRAKRVLKEGEVVSVFPPLAGG